MFCAGLMASVPSASPGMRSKPWPVRCLSTSARLRGLEHRAADALAVTAQVVRERPVACGLEHFPDGGADLQLHALGARPRPGHRADVRDVGQFVQPGHRGLDAFHRHGQPGHAGQAERVLVLPVAGRLGVLGEVAVVDLERDPEAVARVGEERRPQVVDDPDFLLDRELPGARHVGYVVLDADVMVAELAQQPALAPLAALLGGEEFEHHPAQRHQAGVRAVAGVRDPPVQGEPHPVPEVLDGRFVAVHDRVDVVRMDQLPLVSHARSLVRS